jgi:hypothetical protein
MTFEQGMFFFMGKTWQAIQHFWVDDGIKSVSRSAYLGLSD